MSPWWFAWLVLPLGYFCVALRDPGFAAQPKLAAARTRQRWDDLLPGAGGRDGVRRGVVVDLGFILLVIVVGVSLVARAGGPWWTVVAVAAALDLGQDVIIVRAADNPRERRLTLLSRLTWAMYVAYTASAAALIWAFVRSLG